MANNYIVSSEDENHRDSLSMCTNTNNPNLISLKMEVKLIVIEKVFRMKYTDNKNYGKMGQN